MPANAHPPEIRPETAEALAAIAAANGGVLPETATEGFLLALDELRRLLRSAPDTERVPAPAGRWDDAAEAAYQALHAALHAIRAANGGTFPVTLEDHAACQAAAPDWFRLSIQAQIDLAPVIGGFMPPDELIALAGL